MLAGPETRELIRTQRMDYKTNTGEQVFELYPMEYGKGRIRVTVACGGSCEEDLREDYATLGIKALRKRWKDYLKDQFHTQASPRLEYSPPLDLAKPFHVAAEVSDARIGQFDEAAATITLQPDGLFQRLPDLFRGVESEDDDRTAEPCRRLAVRRAERTDAAAGTAHPAVAVPHPFARRLHAQGPAGIVPEASRPGDDQPEV